MVVIDIRIGDSRKLIPALLDESIDCVITSPPYWGPRDYGVEPLIWDDVHGCDHMWGEAIPPRYSKSGKPGPNAVVGARFAQDAARRGDGSSFCSRCGAWFGDLGLEPTPELYLSHLLSIFDLIMPKLKRSGTCFVNLGDTYFSSGYGAKHSVLKPGSMCMIPERFTWGMIERGWILKNKPIFNKLNHMPESAKKRFTRAYEPVYFFVKHDKYYFNLGAVREPHKTSTIKRITQKNVMNQPGGVKQQTLRGEPVSGNASRCNLMVQSLAKQYRGKFDGRDDYEQFGGPRAMTQRKSDNTRYGTDGVGIRDHSGGSLNHPAGKNPGDVWESDVTERVKANLDHFISRGSGGHYAYGGLDSEGGKHQYPKGKNPGDVWDIVLEPFPEAHFATFPLELVRRPILVGCPEHVCVKCGRPERLVVMVGGSTDAFNIRVRDVKEGRIKGLDRIATEEEVDYYDEGEYISEEKELVIAEGCTCNAGFKPGVVLDPFAGSGTVGEFCRHNNRDAILLELNPDYKKFIDERCMLKTPELSRWGVVFE